MAGTPSAQPAKPGLTLLLPVYAGDNAEQLRLAYDSSTVGQTRRPDAAVIVQDGPVGEALAEELARIERESVVPVRIVRLEENGGLTTALNAGIAVIDTEVIARMDADDVSEPERFERQWAVIEEGAALVGTGMVEFDDDPETTGTVRKPPVSEERIRDHARTHNPFNHPTMMYRLDAIRAIGGYEAFGSMEDYWLGVRMIASGVQTANIADPLVRYRVGSGVFERRGGWQTARTEWRLQARLRQMGFITNVQFVRNVIVKGVYRLLPAGLKRVLFSRFVSGGLPGDR